MNFIEQLALIRRLDLLIRKKGTGSPQQLAKRLNISRASLFNYIKLLKELGAPIKYSNCRNSYVYAEDFMLIL